MAPFFWGHGHDVDQMATMVSLSNSKSWPKHSAASRGLTDVMWHSVHIIEAVVHFMVVVVKIVTAPVWWPISRLKSLGKKTKGQPQDSYTTNLNRPLYK